MDFARRSKEEGLKVTKEEAASREVVLNIELDSEDVEPYLDRSYRRMVNRVQIPGFRKGKAPRTLVENYLGKEAMIRDSLDYIAQQSIEKAIETEELDVFGEPDVEVVEVNPPSFKATLCLEPIVDLGDFRSLRIKPDPVEVTDEQVSQVIEQMRYESAPWEPVERAVQFGDLITLDVDGFIDGQQVADDREVEFIPQQDNPMPFTGFSVHLEGVSKGQEKEFTLPIPEDYPDESMQGKECRFKVTIHEIKEKALPEIDDEFAKGVGEGHESVEALKQSVLDNLTAQAERVSQRSFQEMTLQKVIDGAKIEMSSITTNREIDHMLENRAEALRSQRISMDDYLRSASKTEEELREELRPSAEEQVTRFLVLRQLAKEEDLAVEDTDIDSEVDSISGGQSESAESLRQALASESARASVASVILSRKVLERLSEIVQSDDPPQAVQSATDESEDEAPSQSAEEADQAETEDQEGEGASDKQPA